MNERERSDKRSMLLMALASWLIAIPAFGQRQNQPWLRHIVDDSSRGADGVKLADVNADGRLDIVTGWEEGGITRAYLHPGFARAKTSWPAVTVGRTPSVEDAVWADLDGDDFYDVVTCCEGTTRTVFVHWASSDQTQILSASAWQQAAVPALKDRMQWMFAQPAQIDGANGIDLVLGGKGTNAQLGWLQSPANPRDLRGWTWHTIDDVGWIMSIIVSDMDRDNNPDFLITDRRGAARGCRWLENPGPGSARSQPWSSHPITGQDREVMFAAQTDLDGDGLQDVVVAVKRAEILLARRADESGRNWRESTVAFPENMGTAKGIAAGDIDSDGRIDLVVSCEGATPPLSGLRWLSYKGRPFDSAWQGHEISGPAGIKFDRIELLDLDGDGDLDVLTCEERHNNRGLGVIWYENPFGPAHH